MTLDKPELDRIRRDWMEFPDLTERQVRQVSDKKRVLMDALGFVFMVALFILALAIWGGCAA